MSRTTSSAGKLRADRAQSRVRVFIVVTTFAIVLVGGVMIGSSRFLSPNPSVPDDIYTGTVRLGPDEHNQCRQFEFDNRSAALRPLPSGPCVDERAERPGSERLGGSIGRMQGISDHFKRR